MNPHRAWYATKRDEFYMCSTTEKMMKILLTNLSCMLVYAAALMILDMYCQITALHALHGYMWGTFMALLNFHMVRERDEKQRELIAVNIKCGLSSGKDDGVTK